MKIELIIAVFCVSMLLAACAAKWDVGKGEAELSRPSDTKGGV